MQTVEQYIEWVTANAKIKKWLNGIGQATYRGQTCSAG